MKKRKKLCIACKGTGKSSKGWACLPCKGTGFKKKRNPLFER